MPEGRSRIPVYLPDMTIIGTAITNVDANTATIKITADNPSVIKLIQESLVGVALVYMGAAPEELTDNKEKH